MQEFYLILFDMEQFADHLPAKNEFCPEVEMKDFNKCNLTLQLESVDDLIRVASLRDGKQPWVTRNRDCRYV